MPCGIYQHKKGRKPTERQMLALKSGWGWWKGKKRPNLSGKNHWRWKGGVTKKQIGRNWNEKNRAYRNFLTLKRKSLKIKAKGSHTFGEWELMKKQYGFACPACHKLEPEIKLSEDHIIPLSRGGSNNIENIQPLCRSCNSRKRDKIIPKFDVLG